MNNRNKVFALNLFIIIILYSTQNLARLNSYPVNHQPSPSDSEVMVIDGPAIVFQFNPHNESFIIFKYQPVTIIEVEANKTGVIFSFELYNNELSKIIDFDIPGVWRNGFFVDMVDDYYLFHLGNSTKNDYYLFDQHGTQIWNSSNLSLSSTPFASIEDDQLIIYSYELNNQNIKYKAYIYNINNQSLINDFTIDFSLPTQDTEYYGFPARNLGAWIPKLINKTTFKFLNYQIIDDGLSKIQISKFSFYDIITDTLIFNTVISESCTKGELFISENMRCYFLTDFAAEKVVTVGSISANNLLEIAYVVNSTDIKKVKLQGQSNNLDPFFYTFSENDDLKLFFYDYFAAESGKFEYTNLEFLNDSSDVGRKQESIAIPNTPDFTIKISKNFDHVELFGYLLNELKNLVSVDISELLFESSFTNGSEISDNGNTTYPLFISILTIKLIKTKRKRNYKKYSNT